MLHIQPKRTEEKDLRRAARGAGFSQKSVGGYERTTDYVDGIRLLSLTHVIVVVFLHAVSLDRS